MSGVCVHSSELCISKVPDEIQRFSNLGSLYLCCKKFASCVFWAVSAGEAWEIYIYIEYIMIHVSRITVFMYPPSSLELRSGGMLADCHLGLLRQILAFLLGRGLLGPALRAPGSVDA